MDPRMVGWLPTDGPADGGLAARGWTLRLIPLLPLEQPGSWAERGRAGGEGLVGTGSQCGQMTRVLRMAVRARLCA